MAKVTIHGVDGNVYEYDQDTQIIFINGMIPNSQEYEPVYAKSGTSKIPPIFSGIYIVNTGQVVGLNGNINFTQQVQ